MVKLSLCFICLIKHHTMKVWRYSTPHILNLGIRCNWSDSYRWGNRPQYSVDRRLGRPQSWSGHGKQKNLYPYQESNQFPGCPACSQSLYSLGHPGSQQLILWSWSQVRTWSWMVEVQNLKKAAVTYFKGLFWHVWYPGQDMNWMPSKYKLQVLLLHHATN